jgi:hypothetical protein
MLGGTLGERDVARSMLGQMAADIDAAALLVYRAAWTRDVKHRRTTKEAAMAKLVATELAQRVIDDAVQLHGARGVARGECVERLYREIRALRIYEGATEVQRLVIGRELLRPPPAGDGTMNASGHVDTFARDNLPPRDAWPEFLFDLPELQYPARVNCGAALLDGAVARGWGARTAIIAEDGSRLSYAGAVGGCQSDRERARRRYAGRPRQPRAAPRLQFAGDGGRMVCGCQGWRRRRRDDGAAPRARAHRDHCEGAGDARTVRRAACR